MVGLRAKGQIHHAMERINSFWVPDLRDPAVMEQMIQKHPPRWEALRERVKLESPVDNLKGLKESLLDLKPGGLQDQGVSGLST